MRFEVFLLEEGYQRFHGAVDEEVYVFFRCPHHHKAKWFVKREPLSFQCAGCKEQCETDGQDGFQLTLF